MSLQNYEYKLAEKEYPYDSENKTLQDILRCNSVVFKGVRVGGLLRTDASVPITNSTPCTADFSNIYSLTFDNNEEFLTIIRDKKRGPGAYFYQNDYKDNAGKWFRDTGVGFLITENELAMNSGEGTTSRLVLSYEPTKYDKCNNGILGNKYKQRISLIINSESNNTLGKFQPFSIFGYNLKISSERERNSKIPCNSDNCYGWN